MVIELGLAQLSWSIFGGASSGAVGGLNRAGLAGAKSWGQCLADGQPCKDGGSACGHSAAAPALARVSSYQALRAKPEGDAKSCAQQVSGLRNP